LAGIFQTNRRYGKKAMKLITAGIEEPMQRLIIMADAFASYLSVSRAIDVQKLLSLYKGRYAD